MILPKGSGVFFGAADCAHSLSEEGNSAAPKKTPDPFCCPEGIG